MKILPARGLIKWVLRRTGFGGVTLPWGIYILAERLADRELIAHEQAHARQIELYGLAGFYARYAYQMLRHGYWNAPLEIEARAAARAERAR